jgi:hypothetical protein
MTYLRRAGEVDREALLHFPVRLRLPLVLSHVFCPRIHEKYLQIAICNFGIAKDPPPICAIATSYATVLIDRRHEFHLTRWDNRVLDRHQHRSSLKVSCSLSDDNRHAPVVPWAEIRSRLRKPCEEHEDQTRDRSNARTNQGASDTCSLCYRAPGCASKREASLINENEDCEHSITRLVRFDWTARERS